MSQRLQLPFGRGMNCHQEQIGNTGAMGDAASTYFPWARVVRLDDYFYPGDTSRSPLNSLNRMRARHNYYREDAGGFPFFICQDIDASWGQNGAPPSGHMVDHARDLLSLGTVDLLLMPNEPDGNANISPTDYANWAKEIKRYAVQMVPNVLLGGPQLSTWSLVPSDQRNWLQTFIDEGGLDALDVFCIHPYCQSQDPRIAIPGFISDLLPRIRGKPFVFTEMGIQSYFCDQRFGDHTAAHMAQGMADYVTGCSGHPCILYDGPYDLNRGSYGGPPGIDAIIQVTANSAMQTVNSTTGMATHMQLAFFDSSGLTFKGLRTLLSFTGSSITLDSAVSLIATDQALDLDYNASMSYWVGPTWSSDGIGQTSMGSDLVTKLPSR